MLRSGQVCERERNEKFTEIDRRERRGDKGKANLVYEKYSLRSRYSFTHFYGWIKHAAKSQHIGRESWGCHSF